MKAVAQVAELQVLEQLLQERLHKEMPQGDFLEVQCVIKNGTLMVLSQHPAEVVPEPKSMLEGLQRAIQSLQLQFTQSVQLDLKVAGQNRPYATHSFTLQRPISVPIEQPDDLEPTWNTKASPAEEYKDLNRRDEPPPPESHDGITQPSSGWLKQVTPAPVPTFVINQVSSGYLNQAPIPNLTSLSVPVTNLAKITQGRTQFPQINYGTQKAHAIILPPVPNLASVKQSRHSKLPLPILLAGAGLGLAASLEGIHLLDRACVIGSCEPITHAQQLLQESSVAAQQAKSHQQLTAVQQRVAEATAKIQTIPQWSPRYQESQKLEQTFSALSATLNQVMTALEKASAATQKSQNPPYTVQQWQAIAVVWRDAIALLEAVPSDSVLLPLAEQKLPGYQASLKSVNQQLNAEQQAIKKLTRANVTATVATKRQGTAQSLQNWQQVQSKWHLAVNELASIPKTSTPYKEAQQLLEIYRFNLAAVRDRTTREQISAKAYNQAVSLATLATRYEQQNQLTLALTTWTEALNEAKQVSDETFYYGKTQSLIDSYSTALGQAEEKLRVANVLQKARTDLDRTCLGELKVCDYSLNSVGITVHLTEEYEQTLDRLLKTAAATGDLKMQASVAEHYKTLQQALEAISHNANLPIEVFGAQGSLVHSYHP